MSLAQRVKLELDDGREVVTVYDGRDLRAWETAHKKSSLVENMSLDMLTWLGHHAAVRRGELNGELSTYPAFDAVCVSVEGLRDESPDPPKGSRRASPKKAGDEPSPP